MFLRGGGESIFVIPYYHSNRVWNVEIGTASSDPCIIELLATLLFLPLLHLQTQKIGFRTAHSGGRVALPLVERIAALVESIN